VFLGPLETEAAFGSTGGGRLAPVAAYKRELHARELAAARDAGVDCLVASITRAIVSCARTG
jgi:hypothetical protein